MDKCPFCGALEHEWSAADPDPDHPHYFACDTEPGEFGKECLKSQLSHAQERLREAETLLHMAILAEPDQEWKDDVNAFLGKGEGE